MCWCWGCVYRNRRSQAVWRERVFLGTSCSVRRNSLLEPPYPQPGWRSVLSNTPAVLHHCSLASPEGSSLPRWPLLRIGFQVLTRASLRQQDGGGLKQLAAAGVALCQDPILCNIFFFLALALVLCGGPLMKPIAPKPIFNASNNLGCQIHRLYCCTNISLYSNIS